MMRKWIVVAGLSGVMVMAAACTSNNANLMRLELSSGELTPAFETATTSYTSDVACSFTGLTITTAVEHEAGVVELAGLSATGVPLAVEGSSVSGLTPGENTIEIVVTAEDGTTKTGYTVAVTRAGPSGDVFLHELQLSEGPPSPGFVMSAMTGQLPEGTLNPLPLFDPCVASYAATVDQPVLTIRARAAAGTTSMSVVGRSADGAELPFGNVSRIGGVTVNGVSRGSFLSATASGLTAGDNTIEITLGADDEDATRSYTLAVTHSAAR